MSTTRRVARKTTRSLAADSEGREEGAKKEAKRKRQQQRRKGGKPTEDYAVRSLGTRRKFVFQRTSLINVREYYMKIRILGREA
jgi:hypothetical protein